MAETKYSRELRGRLEKALPGCMIIRNDPKQRQGVPDLLVLYKSYWAALEVKDDASSPYQPNQEWYLEHMNDMSYASVIHPDNEEEVTRALQATFGVAR